MRQLFVLLLLMFSVVSANAEDGLILREPGLEQPPSAQTQDHISLPSTDFYSDVDNCDSEQDANNNQLEQSSAANEPQPKADKSKPKPKKDPGMLDWMFKKHKMPSLHFIDLLEIIH